MEKKVIGQMREVTMDNVEAVIPRLPEVGDPVLQYARQIEDCRKAVARAQMELGLMQKLAVMKVKDLWTAEEIAAAVQLAGTGTSEKELLERARTWILARVQLDEEDGSLPDHETDVLLDELETKLKED